MKIIDATKAKASKIGNRSSYAFNIVTLALIGIIYVGAHTGHVHGDVEFTGFSIGGGTEQHAAREQQLAALSSAIPDHALAAPSPDKAAPVPAKKPAVK